MIDCRRKSTVFQQGAAARAARMRSLPQCRVGEYGREFFAAEPPYDVARARLQAQQFSEVAERAVTERTPQLSLSDLK